MSAWQRWLHHPESLSVRKALFQLHLWVGVGAGVYVLLMSLSGSVIVFRDQLDNTFLVSFVEWLVNFHSNLSSGLAGRFVNGIGAICVTSLCLTGIVIWWPGILHWRRALTVNWKSHFARINWDVHSALGFWCLAFVLAWAVSGFYLATPGPIDDLSGFLDPNNKVADKALYWFSLLHFGRFGWFAEAPWSLFGLVPAVLAATGILVCCHRMISGVRQSHRDNPEEYRRSRIGD